MGLVSGDRVLLKNATATASTTGPVGPKMCDMAQTMGALPLIRFVETGKIKTVRDENCKLRPHTLAVGHVEGGVRRRTAPPRHSPTQQST